MPNTRWIQTRFPGIERLSFRDNARVWPGELQRLKDRLQNIKEFDTNRVVESLKQGLDY